MKKTIGILALQGAFREHGTAIKRTGNYPIEIREVEQLDHVDGLIIPGGESTTISKLMVKYGFDKALKVFKKPIFGTCAGAVLMAKKVTNLGEPTLDLMDIEVERNAYGRQIDSFEENLKIKSFSKIYRGVFIRAPIIRAVSKKLEVLSRLKGKPVLVKQSKLLAATFHPELTEDYRIHNLFVKMTVSAMGELEPTEKDFNN